MNLLKHLQDLFRQALTRFVTDPGKYPELVKPAQDAKFGDYQANMAMPLAKELGQQKNVRGVAQQLADALPKGDMLEAPEIAGPGFINLRLRPEWLAAQLQRMAADERLGIEKVEKPLTYVIDYSSPNVAKPMHVGHLRSTIIGDALARLLRFLGHKVVGDNHLGDWGTQFGMILLGWKQSRDEKAYQRDPVTELARLYRLVQGAIKPAESWGRDLDKFEQLEREGKSAEAKKLFDTVFGKVGKSREEIAGLVGEGRKVEEAAKNETVKLHEGDAENRRLWKEFMPHCLAALQRVYDRLDVHFDEQLGESAYDEMLPGVVEDLRKKGLVEESQGAQVVFVEGLEAPFMVQKSDGAFNYATTDLATIKYRHDHFKPDVMLYVVDRRQGDHFRALFDVARRWGYAGIVMEHIGFGTINGRDGKPYKTREGDVVGLESLLDEAVARARQVVDANSPELSPEERASVAEIVGLGAVNYADLSQNRLSDYTYDEDKMLATDGNTATYMQYAYARNRAIFRKGDEDVAPLRTSPPLPSLGTPEERALAAQLVRFHEALDVAAAECKPNVITAYLWELARAYSGFYVNCPVLNAETPELRRSRLLLCDLTARVIRQGLELLGIRTAERM